MIQSIENQRVEIFNPGEGPQSSTTKNSNENTPNIPKKSPQQNTQLSEHKNPLNNDLNHFFKTPLEDKVIDNKSTDKNITINNINSSQNICNESNNKKEFTEKKRRRRSKCSYSNNRNKKSKKRINYQEIKQLNHSVSNVTPIKDLNYEAINANMTNLMDLQEVKIKESEKNNEKENKRKNENNQNCKKKTKIDEKELIANSEKIFMEKLNKEYSDEQYNKDLNMNLKEKKAQFMKENFPIMFRKDKYYLYTILLKERRTQPINFIQPNTLSQNIQESKKHQTLYLNEEPNNLDNISSENSDDERNKKIKTQIFPSSKNSSPKQKSQIKISKNSLDSEIISSFNQDNNNNHKISIEVEQIKKDLTEPKQQTQKLNKKHCSGLSDTSPSEHEGKNNDSNHIVEDIEKQNKYHDNEIKYKKTFNLLPKHIWSFPKEKNELDIEMFFDDCIQIWPFDECIFSKEIALEFLMKNKYSTTICLNRIKDFVSFMKKRAEELNMSIINKNEKTVKKYSLRNTKNN